MPDNTSESILLGHIYAFIKWEICALSNDSTERSSVPKSNVLHCIIRGSFHIVLSSDLAVITGGARPVSRPVLTGYAGVIEISYQATAWHMSPSSGHKWKSKVK